MPLMILNCYRAACYFVNSNVFLLQKLRLFGWKSIWVVLERGVLSVFASRSVLLPLSVRLCFSLLLSARSLLYDIVSKFSRNFETKSK